MKKAVILLYTYNEKENLEKFVGEVLNQEKHSDGWNFEILIADSSSPDGTFEIAKRLAKNNPKIHAITVGKGLGVAVIEGHQYSIKHLKPDALVQLDADGQAKADVVPRLLKTIDEGYNLALGSRFVKGGKNDLTLLRRIFTWGSCTFSRLIMGPLDIQEFTNSARAFTPELFNKINLKRLPWREQSYIIQPAFLNEAVLAGAKYKEVPLYFKNREEGYSKNKVFNYTYDVITYSIDARLRKWGFNGNFFRMSRRAKTFIKFGIVGVTGTIVDFAFYKIFINGFDFNPATAKGFSAEIAVVNNFIWNNFWTFKYRKTKTNLGQKFLIFNLVSVGGIVIGVLIVKLLDMTFGSGYVYILGRHIAYNNFYFFATIPPVMIWNFVANHLITWKNKED
ncbi:MAG: GtrA family protein [Candidatus Daviesbacteria bacterium]|nr:GtrA family protein [Candidatus Daviesbacteria bacterium]